MLYQQRELILVTIVDIRFGNGNDLRISHTSDLSSQNDSNGDSVLDGSTWASYIQEAGTGPLIFKSNGGPYNRSISIL